MTAYDLSPDAQLWVNAVLLWVGYGAVVGLLTRGVLPGKEPQGPLSTFVIGSLGCLAGPFLLVRFGPFDKETFNPVSLFGFLASFGCAIVLLLVFKIAIRIGHVFLRSKDDGFTLNR